MPAIVLVAFGLLKSGVVAIFTFVDQILSTRLGQYIAITLVAFTLGYKHAANVYQSTYDAREAQLAAQAQKLQAQIEAEKSRRDFAIKMAAQQARSDTDQIQHLEDQLRAIKKDTDHASHANDRRPGLPLDGVRRLKRIRP